MKKLYIVGILILMSICALALESGKDSSAIVIKEKKSKQTVMARVHTMGLFLYMGKVVNNNPAADIYYNYTASNGFGFSAFKATDLNDIHSANNFALVYLNKTFHLGKRLTVAPSIGAALEQQHGVASHGSDMTAMLTTSLKLSPNVVLEHTSLFNNLVFETSDSDWTNRIRCIYSKSHFDVIGMGWHNNGLIDHESYMTTGLSVYYSRVPVAKRVFLSAGITGLMVAQRSNEENGPNKNGIQFTTALTIK